MHHLDSQLLLKIVVIVATAVVIVYFGSIGYLDFTASTATPDNSSSSALVKSGNYARAIKSYRAEINTLETQSVNALLALADVYAKNEQPAEAEATYKKAIARDPETVDAYLGLAKLQRDQARYAEAETTVTAGLVELPNDVNLLKFKDDLANRDTTE